MRKLPKNVANYRHALESVLLEDKMPETVINDLNQALSGVNGSEVMKSSLHKIDRDIKKSSSDQLVNRRYSVSESDITNNLLSVINETFSNQDVVRQLKRKKQLAVTSAVQNHMDVEFSWKEWLKIRVSGPAKSVLLALVILLLIVSVVSTVYIFLNRGPIEDECNKKDELVQTIELQMQQADQFKEFIDGKLDGGIDSIYGVDLEKARRNVNHYSEEINRIRVTLNSVPNSCERSFIRSKKSESYNLFRRIERLKNRIN